MNPGKSESVKKLQDLLSVNIDSQQGFQEAARDTNDPQLRQLFADFEQRRAQNAAELRQYIAASGETPTTKGTMSGTIHRWWIDAKQALTGNDAQSILNEAERGEDSIKHTYEKALRDLSIDDQDARSIVERQFSNVRDGHDQIKRMRDATKIRNPRG